jgi:hypothetical protein
LPARSRTRWEFDCARVKLGLAAVYENAFVQRRCDMESAPAAGGDRHTHLVLLLVWFAKAHPSPKDCELARSENAKRSRGTGSGAGAVDVVASVLARVRLCLCMWETQGPSTALGMTECSEMKTLFQISPVHSHSNFDQQGNSQCVNFFHLVAYQRSHHFDFGFGNLEHQFVVHLQGHPRFKSALA